MQIFKYVMYDKHSRSPVIMLLKKTFKLLIPIFYILESRIFQIEKINKVFYNNLLNKYKIYNICLSITIYSTFSSYPATYNIICIHSRRKKSVKVHKYFISIIYSLEGVIKTNNKRQLKYFIFSLKLHLIKKVELKIVF